MHSSTPYIIGGKREEYRGEESGKIKKYRRRRVYVLNIRRIVMFSIAIILLLSAITATFVYRNFTRFRFSSQIFYYLQLKSVDDGATAMSLASDFAKKGGAGYIINDGDFRIMVSVYSDKGDAITVCNRYIAEYPQAEIYELKIPAVNFMKFTEKELARELYGIYKEIRLTLFDKLQSLDFSYGKGELSQAAVLSAISALKRDFLTPLINKTSDLRNGFPASEALECMNDFLSNILAMLETDFPAENFTVTNKIKLTLCRLCRLYLDSSVIFQKL